MKRLGLLAAACATLLATAACGSAEGSDDSGANGGTVTLRVGVLGVANTQKALLEASGQDRNLPGYTIEWSLFPAGPQLVEAEKAGSVDIGMTATTPAIFAQAAGTPIKVVAANRPKDPAASTQAIVVPKDSPIRTVADLKGKKIAITRGTILQYLVIKVLAKEGLTYNDIKPVDLPVTDGLAAFKRGDVDALSTIDPFFAQASLQSGAQVLVSGAGYPVGGTFQLARAEALGDDRLSAAIADYLKRIKAASEWQNTNLDTWATTYAQLNNIPVELARTTLTRGATVPVSIDQSVIADQQDQADTYFELGLLPKKLDVAAEFDTRFNSIAQGAK